jgi:hypothetical protein
MSSLAPAGALAGALQGRSWIPPRWYDNIENGPGGRDEFLVVTGRLADMMGAKQRTLETPE